MGEKPEAPLERPLAIFRAGARPSRLETEMIFCLTKHIHRCQLTIYSTSAFQLPCHPISVVTVPSHGRVLYTARFLLLACTPRIEPVRFNLAHPQLSRTTSTLRPIIFFKDRKKRAIR